MVKRINTNTVLHCQQNGYKTKSVFREAGLTHPADSQWHKFPFGEPPLASLPTHSCAARRLAVDFAWRPHFAEPVVGSFYRTAMFKSKKVKE